MVSTAGHDLVHIVPASDADFQQDRLMRLFQNIEKGTFIARPNRFVIECAVRGKTTRAYLPNPGRLLELLLPGSTLYLVRQSIPDKKRIPYMAVAVEKGGSPVLLHTHVNNKVAAFLIEQNRIPGLEGAVIIRPEITIGKSRFDFLLRKGRKEIVLEVKSCTLFSGRTAMFPDAVTARGKRHLEELASLAGGKRETAVLFLVHAHAAEYFLPDYHTDPDFAAALMSVMDRVMVRAVSVEWRKQMVLGSRTSQLVVPREFIRKESRDRGSYILILRLDRQQTITVGRRGDMSFKKGYYLYAGSAGKALSKRTARHRRKRKNLFWHIDYLREHAEFCTVLPVRTSEDLKCEIACALDRIAQWHIPSFGSSDCSCTSHLFGMDENPLTSSLFIETLMHFRISRVEEALTGAF